MSPQHGYDMHASKHDGASQKYKRVIDSLCVLEEVQGPCSTLLIYFLFPHFPHVM
jgi:hypothetical protein